MRKALLVTTVSGFVPQFEMNNVRLLQQMGYEVHYAANYHMVSYGKDNHRLDGTGIIRHQVDFVRSPFKIQNFQVYRQLKDLMRQESFDLVHCHTPMGGVMARLAAHGTKTRPVIYTAHGFHFFQGAPLINWLCYYPMEKWLSRYTDQQICINREDYERAKRFYAKQVDYVPGVGIDLAKIPVISNEVKREKRKELGILEGKIVILSAGELIRRKNHESVIRAIANLKNPQLCYVICGHGELESYLYELVQKLGIEEQVLFAGYRSDIFDIYQSADIYAFPSYQEGLPMALLEAMASGAPVVCSDIRGSRDLMGVCESEVYSSMKICEGGIMVKKADDVDGYAQALQHLLDRKEEWTQMGMANKKNAEGFTIEAVARKMKEIYERNMN